MNIWVTKNDHSSINNSYCNNTLKQFKIITFFDLLITEIHSKDIFYIDNKIINIHTHTISTKMIMYRINTIESLNSILRKFTKIRTVILDDDNLFKSLYLAQDKILENNLFHTLIEKLYISVYKLYLKNSLITIITMIR